MLTCGKAFFARHDASVVGEMLGVVQFLCSQICKWLQCKCAVVALCGEATLRHRNLVKVRVYTLKTTRICFVFFKEVQSNMQKFSAGGKGAGRQPALKRQKKMPGVDWLTCSPSCTGRDQLQTHETKLQ